MHPTDIAAFINHKGGVGKTTSVANVGAALAILGRRVLLVDLDPQGHLTTFLGAELEPDRPTVHDVLRGRALVRETIVEKPLRARLTVDGHESTLSMSLVPSTIDVAGVETTLADTPRREFLLRDALAPVRSDYDHVLIDCPPGVGLITTNALAAARRVFIPVQTEFLALESLRALIARVESVARALDLDVEIGGIIATRYDARKVLGRAVVQSLREEFGALLLETVIRENIALAESPRRGRDIFSYRPRSTGAQDYLRLAMEILGRIPAAERVYSVERGVIHRESELPV